MSDIEPALKLSIFLRAQTGLVMEKIHFGLRNTDRGWNIEGKVSFKSMLASLEPASRSFK